MPGSFPYQNLDLRFWKDFPNFGGSSLGVTADLFNALNHNNSGCCNSADRNATNFGEPTCVVSDARRLQVGLEYTF